MNAKELRRRRDALGITQRELATRLGVDMMTVSRWERGLHRIPEAVALAIQHLKPKKAGGRRKS